MADESITSLRFANETAKGFKKKADHNKNESLICFSIIVLASLVSPVFVTLGDGLIWGKIIPSVLSLSAAASTTWLQLRKPQSLWALYRDCQRRIEDNINKYCFRLGEYSSGDNERNQLLAERVRQVAWDAHQRWLPLVPTPEAIGANASKSTGYVHDRNS